MTTAFADDRGSAFDIGRAAEPMSAPAIDAVALRTGRLARLRATMIENDIDVCLLTNPVSIRYATGYADYAQFQSRIPSAYLVVPADGPIVLHGAYSRGLETISATRASHAPTVFDAGFDLRPSSLRFIADVIEAISEAGLGHAATLGVERLLPTTHRALEGAGCRIVDAEPTVELARSRKSDLEIDAMRHAIAVAEHGMSCMAVALRPGISENQLWSVMHQVNIVNGGEWFDGRMLCSGPRTNPWYQEASGRTIDTGDLVAFDTDMIGPHGYCADISRTWVCTSSPTPAQRDLHARAVAEIEHNTALLHVGASFAEIAHRVFAHPDEIVVNRYACAFHGVGMTDEYPKIPYPQDWATTGYDGEIEEGLVLSVESYVGREGDREGVKLEQMLRVTSDGVQTLSTSPLELMR